MSADPAALQLRLLQTVVEVAAEKNSTLVMPFPVELLRFFDNATQAQGWGQGDGRRYPTPGDSPRDDDVSALSGASPRGGVTLAGSLNGTGTAPAAR